MSTAPVINQKEYLKKYLNIGKDKDKKKKKKKKANIIQNRVKIIDDNIDIINTEETLTQNELDEFLTQEDAPQVVGVVDDRPLALRLDDYRKNSKWKLVGSDDESKTPSNNSNHNSRKNTQKDSSLKRYKKTNNDSDESPPRKKNRNSESPPYRGQEKQSDSQGSSRRNYSSDVSPKRKNYDSDPSPPRKIKSERKSPDSDASPPRRRQSPDSNSRRNNKNYDSDPSPPRKNTWKSVELSAKIKHESDASSSRKNRRSPDLSPERRKNKDARPLQKTRSSNLSPQRKNYDSDVSPPRKNSKRSPDLSPQRRRKHSKSLSPPRKTKRNDLHPKKTDYKKSDRAKKSRWGEWSPEKPTSDLDSSPPRKENQTTIHKKLQDSSVPGSSKMEKTLDGKTAGLQNAKDLKHETQAFKKREEELFKKMSQEVSGINAAPVIRDRKTGKKRDFEKETMEEFEKLKKDKEQKEKYDRWGKGLKQVEKMKEKIQSDIHEMNKPLARYADDEDLERYLKEQERDGDPMLAYLRKKKRKEAVAEGKQFKPVYEGEFMPNRFGIPPGHRWDGVDRSNGYEKQWFNKENAKKAMEEEIYKWSTEDM